VALVVRLVILGLVALVLVLIIVVVVVVRTGGIARRRRSGLDRDRGGLSRGAVVAWPGMVPLSASARRCRYSSGMSLPLGATGTRTGVAVPMTEGSLDAELSTDWFAA